MNKLLTFFFVALAMTAAHADDEGDTGVQSFYVTANASMSGVEIDHRETSTTPAFNPLNSKTNIPFFSLRLGLGKEFLAEHFLSFTVTAEAGGMMGRAKEHFDSTNIQYRDKASGTSYGFGGTLNTNFSYSRLRVQPFGGVSILKSKSEYKLNFTPMSASQPSTDVNYDEDGTQTFINAGVRLFDPRMEVFSLISIQYEASSSFTQTVKAARLNGSNVAITDIAEITHKPLTITLGLGLMF